MNLIDNLIYAAKNPSQITLPGGETFEIDRVVSRYWPNNLNLDGNVNNETYPPLQNGISIGSISSYDAATQITFICHDDCDYIEEVIQKHWFDIGYRISYQRGRAGIFPDPQTGENIFSNFVIPPYHLIYAYLLENTRIIQIFTQLLKLYLTDEILNKPDNEITYRWMQNTENLFFKKMPNSSYRNIEGQLTPASEITRRNAYRRLFGMDLAFAFNEKQIIKASEIKFSNQSFILLFENFLTEFWKAYINATNTSGANTTDVNNLSNLITRIQELLMARRTNEQTFNNYRFFNLSKVEYSANIMLTWFHNIISANTQIIEWLACTANTEGERLLKIGEKVGIKAHQKSINLIDMALPMSELLIAIENDLIDPERLQNLISIRRDDIDPQSEDDAQNLIMQNNILTVINNWEQATGHRIKPESKAKVEAKVSVLSN